MEKIIAVYKPKGPTSHDVVDEVRRATSERRVGHAGTLDPLARGVLVVGIGREATRRLNEIVKKEKEYIAKIKLGETSSTDDDEGVKQKIGDVLFSNSQEFENSLRTLLPQFIGKVMQTPPAYSAVKVGGEEAYKRVRRGEVFELKPREIEIKEIEILEYNWPFLTLRVVTGPGVYIRALARDIGRELGVGGYLADLERTRVGDFKKEDAIALGDLKNKLNPL